MTREVKVGLALILVLLVVFGVVLANRLMRDAEQAAELGTRQSETRSSAESKPDESGSLKGATYTAGKPTIVAPETKPAGTASSSPAEVGQWSASAQGPVQPAPDLSSSTGALPSYMPNPPQAQTSDPYDRYGSPYQSLAAQQTWQSEPAGPAPLPTGQSTDPFQGRTSGVSQGSPAQHPDAAQQQSPSLPSLRLVDPSGQAAAGSSGLAAGSSGYGTPTQTYQQSPYGAQTQRPSGAYAQGAVQSPVQQQASSGTGSPWQQSSPPGYSDATGGSSTGSYGTSGGAYGGYSGYGKSSSGVASVQTTAVRREDGTYEVQPNDSFWTISEKFYGTGAYFRALAEHNRSRVPFQERLAVGDVISVPDLSELEKNYADLCPKPERREAVKTQAAALAGAGLQSGGQTYTVQEGDTLFDIARYELGDAARWVEIYQLNRHVLGEDFDYLRPGLKLVLPGEAGSPDPVTRLPGSQGAYQR